MLAGLESDGLVQAKRLDGVFESGVKRSDKPQIFHQDLNEITLAEHEIILQCLQMIQESELVEEDVE